MKKITPSKRWAAYRKQKAKLIKNKKLDFFDLANEKKVLLKKTRELISKDYSIVAAIKKEKAFLIKNKKVEPYPGFKFTRKFETATTAKNPGTQQYFIKVKQRNIKDYDTDQLDDIIEGIINEKNCVGVGLVLKVEYKGTGQIGHVSKFYTRLGIKRIKERGKTLFDDLEKKLKEMDTKSAQEYILKGIYIRIIYEKSKKSSK